VPSQKKDGQNNNLENQRRREKDVGDVQGGCREEWQITESILAFVGG
jgi:hypothetical protein